MKNERILFLTGRLAESSLRRVLEPLSRQAGFEYDVSVLGISVAALMHADWVKRKFSGAEHFDRIILPGWCQGNLQSLCEQFGKPFERGPKNLFDLPDHFGREKNSSPDLSHYDIEILAEINHAPHLSDEEILRQANAYRSSGADVIDLGCVPGETWNRADDVTRLLRAEGFRVSIDSNERSEVEAAVSAGAELVLSCHTHNLDWVSDLDAELVVIPDDPHDVSTMTSIIDVLREKGNRFRVDPILEPIGFGFARSLGRYFEVRRNWPDVEIMMGIGNVTELTEVDTAGINVMLAAICQELGIRSVLTTQVINWAQSAVKEFDLSRRLVHYSIQHNELPKHLDPQLVMLRDTKVFELGGEELARLASQLTDPNYRVFVERGEIHVLNRDGYWHGRDPYELFDQMTNESRTPDASHAFYLGYELSKAVTALTLGKRYTQDQALQWGFLTIPEHSAHERRRMEEC